MGLKEDLKRLKPGDTFPLSGDIRGLGKVIGLKGEPGKPITLDGLGSGRILSSGVQDVGNLRLEKCSHVVIRNLTLAEATMDEARALQLFGCESVILEDLRFGPNIWLDALHLTDCRQVIGQRLFFDGTGGKGGRGGQIGSHAIYVAAGCSQVIFEDVEASGQEGAPLQVNGEDGAVGAVTFRRVRCVDWQTGAGANILGAGVNIAFEDLTLRSAAGNGGVRCFNGARAQVLRFLISVKGKEMLEGQVSVTRGTPQPPRLDTADPPPPPPDTDLRARLDAVTRERDAALAKLAQVHALTAPG